MKTLQRLVISPSQRHGAIIHLHSDQQHYLRRVLRLSKGDRFIGMDGHGQCWLTSLVGNGTQAQILAPVLPQSELLVPVILLVALPKGNGFDEVVRQATELGVTCLVPVISDRTLLQPSLRKLERWHRIAREAAEQTERPLVPQILEPMAWSTGLETWGPPTPAQRYCCVARQPAPHLLDCLLTRTETMEAERLTPLAQPIVIAVGPEGGWTAAEIEQAVAHHFQLVSLGQRILRTVTAPLVALSLIAAIVEKTEQYP